MTENNSWPRVKTVPCGTPESSHTATPYSYGLLCFVIKNDLLLAITKVFN